MSAELWACRHCGNPGVHNLGAHGYCAEHLSRLYRTFAEDIWQANGVGLASGRLRPEYGPLMADLECIACRASWVGVPGDPCLWCRDHRDRLLRYQRELVLRVPTSSDDDLTPLDHRLRAWAGRLRRAAEVGLITRDEAELAWQRARHRAVAA